LRSVTITNAAAGLAIRSAQQSAPIAPAAPPRVDVLDSLFTTNTIGIVADYSTVSTATMLTLRNTLFTNNATGVQLIGLSNKNKLKLNHNSFVGNGIGLRASGSRPVRAIQQWWGSVAGPRLGDATTCVAAAGAGDVVCGTVDYTPWSRLPTGRMTLAARAGGALESAIGAAALSDDDTLPSSIATLTVPAGAFEQPVDLLLSARAPAELPAGLPGQPTQLSLEITAIGGGQELHQFAGGRSLTLAISYSPADLNGADPARLKLLYWDEAQQIWSATGLRTTPDPVRQRLVVRLEHLSRMRTSALGPPQVTFLPLLLR
jgi:hypothetical protein